MSVIFSYFIALFRKYGIHDLNTIAINIFCGDYTIQDAIVMYRLSLKDIEYITVCISRYSDSTKYIQERTGG